MTNNTLNLLFSKEQITEMCGINLQEITRDAQADVNLWFIMGVVLGGVAVGAYVIYLMHKGKIKTS